MEVPDYVWEGLEALREQIELVAPRQTPVLILGETGTGKETIAREVHARSARKGAFVAVSCPDIAPSIFESELFGHEKGAFTGAIAPSQGLIRAAENGTLFLDEIGELPADLQAKLLRVLQEREVRAVGAKIARKCDFRLVAATNKDLKAQVGSRAFREDLLHRINTFPLQVPPLRERPHRSRQALIDVIAARNQVIMSDGARTLLLAYSYPGNIRELSAFIERAAIQARGGMIEVGHLAPELRPIEPLFLATLGNSEKIVSSLPEFNSWSVELQNSIRSLAEIMMNRHASALRSGVSRQQASRDLVADLEVPESWPGFEVLVHALAAVILWDLATNWPELELNPSTLSRVYGGTFTRRRENRKPLREKVRQLVVERPRG